MSTPRAKYTKKQHQKKENRERRKSESRTEIRSVHSETKVLAVASTISCHSAPYCRICHDDDTEEPLISPCDCKGSMNFCHASCLRSWLTEKVQNLKEPSCEICKSTYEVRYERIGRRDCGIPCGQIRGQREFIHFYIVSFCVLVLFASIAYTTWGAFSTSDLANNFRMSPLAELTYSVYFIIDALCIVVIAVEFNVGILPLIKRWWSSNLSVVVIDKNNVTICSETLRVVEEASSLLEEDLEEIDEEEEEEEVVAAEDGTNGQDEERGVNLRDTETNEERGDGDQTARQSGWWIKLWTRKGRTNSGPREVENEIPSIELGDAADTGSATQLTSGHATRFTEIDLHSPDS